MFSQGLVCWFTAVLWHIVSMFNVNLPLATNPFTNTLCDRCCIDLSPQLGDIAGVKVKVKRTLYLYSAFRETSTEGAQVWTMDHTELPLQTTPYLPLPCERSPDGAT